MLKLFSPLVMIFALQVVSTAVTASDKPVLDGGQFESFFHELVNERGYPGAAFAIVSRDRVLGMGTHGYTNTQRTRRVDTQTTFRLASVSKTFAAEAVALLVADGALSWQDPVVRYVPDFRVSGDTSQIQVQHLLGQSTGLMPHAYDNLLEHGKSMDIIWKRMSDLPYMCEPGSCYGYQNSVFSLVDPIVEHAASMPYKDLVEQRIFKPLEMTNASLGYDAFVGNPNHAEPHARSRDKWKTVSVQRNYYRAAPAAGVNASIRDMARWVQAQLGSKPDVLPPDLVASLFQPRVKTRRELYRKQWKNLLSDAHYGLGWRVYQLGDEQIIYHGGWVSGFRADVAFSPQRDLGIVILINAESSGISELTTRFWQLALAQSLDL